MNYSTGERSSDALSMLSTGADCNDETGIEMGL